MHAATEPLVTMWPWGHLETHVVPDLPGPVGDVAGALVALATEGGLTLPQPGHGRTLDRFVGLAEVSARDLSLGRLFEGHTDALAILDEAGQTPPPAAVMGVWAARRSDADVVAIRRGSGWYLQGRKPWASGAGTLTDALVTAATSDGTCLFKVPLTEGGVAVVPGTWPAIGMAGSDSFDVDLDVNVGGESLVRSPGWYVDRPGFWFGSVGVAACWLGGALGLVRALRSDLTGRSPDPHQVAHLGAAAARCASMARDIAWAAGRIDANPSDPGGDMRRVALEVRHLIEEGCQRVVRHVGKAGGPAPLCHDAAQARRMADLPVYVRQHHGERDDEELGRLLMDTEIEP
jgi:hypothetical protein